MTVRVVIVVMVMIERVVVAVGVLATVFGVAVRVWSAVGVGVLDAAVTVALACEWFVAQEGLVGHADEATQALQSSSCRNVPCEPYGVG
jgi:hypothetical protein